MQKLSKKPKKATRMGKKKTTKRSKKATRSGKKKGTRTGKKKPTRKGSPTVGSGRQSIVFEGDACQFVDFESVRSLGSGCVDGTKMVLKRK